MTELRYMIQLEKTAAKEGSTEVFSSAPDYSKADVSAWNSARKFQKANPNWNYEKVLKDSVMDVPESVRKAAVRAGGAKNLGITDKLRAGGNILAKNIGKWGSKADQLTHARALDNYARRMKQVATQREHAVNGSVLGDINATWHGLWGGQDAAANALASQTETRGKNLPGAMTIPEHTTMNKIQDVAKTYTGMGDYSKSTQHDSAKAQAGLLKPASYAGWAASLGIPVISLLSMLFKGKGGATQQPAAPGNPYQQGYRNTNNPYNANQYRGQ